MKRSFLLNLLLLLNVILTYGADCKTFEFPIKPGDSKWTKLESTYERNQELQIPYDIIKSISTDDLLEVCLNYPFLIEATFYDNQDEALNYLQSHFNGFKELLSRTDLPKVLLKKVSSLSNIIKNISKADENEKGLFAFQDMIIELLLTNKDIVSSFSIKEIENLSTITEENTLLKGNYPEIFGAKNLLTSKTFHKSPNSSNTLNRIYYPNFTSATIYTPNGSLVPNVQKLNGSDMPALTSTQRNYLINYLYANYDGATLEEDPTCKYNAQGWAWHTSRTGEKVHIARDNHACDSIYVHDGSYIRVPEDYSTLVVYGDYYFAATKYDSIWYISKWQEGGPRVKHKLTAMPNGNDSYFTNMNNHPNDIKKFYMLVPHCQISGDYKICSQGVYSLTNLPNGATIQWNCNPQVAGTITTSGNNYMLFTANSNYNGDCTLIAKVFLDSIEITSANRVISVGIPEIISFNFISANNNLGQWTANSEGNHMIVELANDYSANFSYDYRIYRLNNDYSVGSLVEQAYGVSPEDGSFGPYPAGWYLVGLRSYNNCGYSDWFDTEVECVDDNNWRNIAQKQDNEIVIESISADYINARFVNNSSNLSNKTLSTSSERYVAQLWNSNNLIRTSNQIGESFKLSIAGLPKGVYMIKIIRKDVSYSKKILIR